MVKATIAAAKGLIAAVAAGGWVAEQCGYIDAGLIPRFAWCPSGVQWFKDRGQWQDNGYTPRPGDIIFFDWESDGECDHVGIVESVADGKVNTIEGNSGDSCRRRSYDLGSVKIRVTVMRCH